MHTNIREVTCAYISVLTTTGMTQPSLSVTWHIILCWRDLSISNDNKIKDRKLVKATDKSFKNANMF